jgi:hypothetical protein
VVRLMAGNSIKFIEMTRALSLFSSTNHRNTLIS